MSDPGPLPGAQGSARTGRDATLYAAALAFDTVLWLALLPFVTRAVSLETFGQFTLIRVVVPFLLALLDLGCGIATVRTLANTRDDGERRALVGTLLASRALIALGALALGGVVGLVVGGRFGPALAITGGLVAAWTVQAASVDALRGLGHNAAAALSIATAGAVSVVSVFVLAVRLDAGLPGLLGGMAIGSLASALVGVAACRRHLGPPARARYLALVRLGGPIAVYFGLRAAMAFDRYLLGALGGIAHAGLFQLASTPTGGIELMEQAGVLAVEPAVYGAPEAQRPAVLEPIFSVGALLVIGAGLTVGLASPELVRLLGPPEYRGALAAMPLLTLSAVARALARLVGLGAGAAGQMRVWATFQTLEFVLALVLMLVLVPRVGVTGAAIAHLVASIAALAACRLLVHRAAPAFRYALGRALLFLVAAVAATTVLATDLVRAPAPPLVRAAALAGLVVAAIALLGLPLFQRTPMRASIDG